MILLSWEYGHKSVAHYHPSTFPVSQ